MRIIDKKLLSTYRQMACVACRHWDYFVCGHHIKTKGSGGDDVPENLIPLCQRCHAEVHSGGLNRMTTRHPMVKKYISDLGWEFDDVIGKWRRYDNELLISE